MITEEAPAEEKKNIFEDLKTIKELAEKTSNFTTELKVMINQALEMSNGLIRNIEPNIGNFMHDSLKTKFSQAETQQIKLAGLFESLQNHDEENLESLLLSLQLFPAIFDAIHSVNNTRKEVESFIIQATTDFPQLFHAEAHEGGEKNQTQEKILDIKSALGEALSNLYRDVAQLSHQMVWKNGQGGETQAAQMTDEVNELMKSRAAKLSNLVSN